MFTMHFKCANLFESVRNIIFSIFRICKRIFNTFIEANQSKALKAAKKTGDDDTCHNEHHACKTSKE